MQQERGYTRVANEWFVNQLPKAIAAIQRAQVEVPEELAYLDLIGPRHTAWGPFSKTVMGREIKLERGQLLLSYGLLELAYGWTRKRARGFVERLIRNGVLERVREEGKAGTVYRLTIYEEVADSGPANFRHAEKGTVKGTVRGIVGAQSNGSTKPFSRDQGHSRGTVKGTVKGTLKKKNKEEEYKRYNSLASQERRGRVAGESQASDEPDQPALFPPLVGPAGSGGGNEAGVTDLGSSAVSSPNGGQQKGEEGPASLHQFRSQAAGLIKTHLWRSPTPPAELGSGWGIANELSIWNQLARHYDPAELNLAIELLRPALGDPPNPLSLRLFRSRKPSARILLQSCLSAARKRLERQAAGRLQIRVA